MNENNETLLNFELLLQQQSSTRPFGLYGHKKDSDSIDSESKSPLNAKDVLSKVSKQIRAMHTADCGKTYKKSSINMYKCKKSTFIPVNTLINENEEEQPLKTKFETQLFSDTQLLDVVENAEKNALDVNYGMTQEFSTSFFQRPAESTDSNLDGPELEPKFPILDISLKEPNLNKSFDIISSPDDDRMLGDDKILPFDDDNQDITCIDNRDLNDPDMDCNTIFDNQYSRDIHENQQNLPPVNGRIQSEIDANKNENGTQLTDSTQMLKSDIELENIDINLNMTVKEPGSPVFNIKNNKPKSRNQSPLVFNLDRFERFENIALPVIEETVNNDLAKIMINSQIFGKELIIHTDKDPILSEVNNPSPIILLSDDIVIDKEDLDLNSPTYVEKEKSAKDTSKEDSRSDEYILKDEILFSSDEEIDDICKSHQDLPFTCALQTSFYDKSDVLNTTMYVGFQTASNKSIQISSDSFSKAKDILNNIEEDLKTEATLTQLVKNYDREFSVEVKDTENYDINDDIADNGNESLVINTEKDYNQSKEPEEKLGSDFITTVITPSKTSRIHKNIRHDKASTDESTKSTTIKKSGPKTDDCENMLLDLDLDKTLVKNLDEYDFVDKNDNIDPKMSTEQLVNVEDVSLHDFHTQWHTDEYSRQKDLQPSFQGFKTASNRRIELSEKSLEKTKKVFQDILVDKFEVQSNVFETKDNNTNEENTFSTTDVKSLQKEGTNIDKSVSKDDIFKNLIPHEMMIHKTNEDEKTGVTENKEIDGVILKEFEDDIPHTEFLENSPIKIVEQHGLVDSKTVIKKNSTVSHITQRKNIFEDIDLEEIPDKALFSVNLRKVAKTQKSIQEKSIGTEEFANVGFKTASNKNILISEKGLARMKNVFNDIDLGNQFLETEDVNNGKDKISDDAVCDHFDNVTEKSKCTRFHSAIGKEVTVPEQSLMQSDRASKDIAMNILVQPVKNFQTEIRDFSGFKTANHKSIKISAQAFAKTKNIFKGLDADINIDENHSDETKENDLDNFKTDSDKKVVIPDEIAAKILFEKTEEKLNNIGNKEIAGFKTANNKTVSITAKALVNAKKVFGDIEKDLMINETSNDSNEPPFYGFENVDKDIAMFEEIKAESQKIFEKISEKSDYKTVNFQDAADFPNKILNFTGFQTASNKAVTISSEALIKSKKMFQDIDKSLVKEIEESRSTDFSFKGFHTANNKRVEVSEEALAESNRKFQALDTNLKQDSEIVSHNLPLQGFQTASNKRVTISDEALARSRNIFKDFEAQESTVSISENAFRGIQTASGKAVPISDVALTESIKIFQDAEQDVVSQKAQIKSSFKGFQTANNKEVKVSDQALAKSRKLFHEFDTCTSKLQDKSTFAGFQTASKKEVKISEAALAKTKEIFKEIDADIDSNKEINLSSEPNIIKYKLLSEIDSKTDLKESLTKPRKLLLNLDEMKGNTTANILSDVFNKSPRLPNIKFAENLNNMIDTQVLNNFDESLHTEDFLKDTTPKKSKRSGSPILSCPKAKRRKVFQIPYSQKVKSDVPDFAPPKATAKPGETFSFDNNYKKAKQYTLKDQEKIENSSNEDATIDPYILEFTFDNLLQFEFSGSRKDLETANLNPTLNISDLKTIFLNSVNKNLVPDGWIDIHLKLILWKLISYEIKFPKSMGGVCSARKVIEQLKYRYDKELYNAERPALRKIVEKDDTPMRMLVLCVVDVIAASENSTQELLLTDGWYCIKATTDRMLSKLVQNGRIVVGTKLVTHGAELVGSDQAASPWEDTSSLRLKLSGNSTRRAPWHARLGYYSHGAILSRLSTVRQDGGKVSKLRVLVTRVYPALYLDKFEDGSTVTRSERLETIYQVKYEAERQAQLEKIYEDVEREVFEQDSQDSEEPIETGVKRKCSDSGSQIAKMMKRSKDPAEFRSHLTSTQTTLLHNHIANHKEKLIQTIQDKVQTKMAECGLDVTRNVVTLLKIRVADIEENKNGIEVCKGMLSIWKPNNAVTEMITEGAWIEILNVVPTAVRYSEIQLSAGRQSVFSLSKYKESEKQKPFIDSLKRICYPIKDLAKTPSMTTNYNEIDTAGIVFQIDPTIADFDPKKHQFQNVYICDIEKNVICVNFWCGLKKFGYENVLDTGQIVACVNLQKRAGNNRKNIPQFRATEFSYFTKTPKNDTARGITEDLNKKLVKLDKKKFLDDCVSLKHENYTKMQSNENVSPYRFPNMDASLARNKIFVDSPLAQKKDKMDDNLHLTGLDFESTFKQSETQELSPRTLLRKKQVQQKIAKLKMYGEPPPLSPMQMLNKSKNAGKAYKSPLRSNIDISSVASEKKIIPSEEKSGDISCSPVICLNKTYNLKRTNVNPIKLNFSSNNPPNDSLSEIVDDFPEEFDGSPPLSLD